MTVVLMSLRLLNFVPRQSLRRHTSVSADGDAPAFYLDRYSANYP